jgi:hypothetical protein
VTDRHTLIAFGMLLFAICYLATIASLLAYQGKYAEALGFGGLTTGLVGVLGSFRPQQRKVEIDNPPSNPVPVEPQP